MEGWEVGGKWMIDGEMERGGCWMCVDIDAIYIFFLLEMMFDVYPLLL